MTTSQAKIGVLIAGIQGSVSLCTIIGAIAQRNNISGKTGMVSALPFFDHLKLPDHTEFVFGGWDVRDTTLQDGARELYSITRSISREVLESVEQDLCMLSDNVYEGTAFGLEELLSRFPDANIRKETASDALRRLRAAICSFKKCHNLKTVVVVNLASTEPVKVNCAAYSSANSLLSAVEQSDRAVLSPGILYALAAVQEGCAFVNFTPSPGSEIKAISDMADERKIVHAGRDGKTGETLMKTVLAPMFLYRNFKVLSWEGYNMLGNRDGLILDEPGSNKAKTANKDKVLRTILPDPDMHVRTRIDYVPSLDDWKVAWDYIHFEGFLGTRMSLSFQWQGCDSMLAAPLVLDLIRFAAFETQRNAWGVQGQLSVFFKNPINCESHSFIEQFQRLVEFYR